jgi:hypothetical protein
MIITLTAQRASFFQSCERIWLSQTASTQSNCGSPVNGKKRLTVSQSCAQVLLDKHWSVSGLCPHSLDPNNDTIVSCRPGISTLAFEFLGDLTGVHVQMGTPESDAYKL